MSTTTIQVPIDADIKSKATKVAHDMGFSSLQEIIRVFVYQIASGHMNLSLETLESNKHALPKRLVETDKQTTAQAK